LAAVSAAGFEMLAKRMTSEIVGFGSPREQLVAMLRAYIDHGVENPALYSLMFGGYLGGPDRSRRAIEMAEAEKTRALLAGVIVAGGLGRTNPDPPRRTEDCRRNLGVLVPRAWFHSAAGRWARRPEEKVWRAGRQTRAGHARRIGGRISSLAAWHLGRPASASSIIVCRAEGSRARSELQIWPSQTGKKSGP
jgi:hypothetical protein